MASKRRGGGFRPPELRGTLGTLLRTTTDVVRDALERGARQGRARLDDARAHRRRQDALADLGELVLDLIRRGEIDLAELPEARDLVRQLDDFDAEPADDRDPEPPRAATRRRFDDRPRRTNPAAAPAADADGTVSSGASAAPGSAAAVAAAADRYSRPTTPARPRDSEVASARAPTRPFKSFSRPTPAATIDDDADAAAPAAPATPPRPPRVERSTLADRPAPPDRPPPPERPAPSDRPPLRRPLLTPDAQRKGGISFDDDDLNEYMHPDDVPPKLPPRNPGDGEA
jgi:hypothetical protein